MLVASFLVGMVCAALLALGPGTTTYLVASALFGISLAGATASLPVLVVAQVSESSAGLAKFRISAGIGMLVGFGRAAPSSPPEISIAALFGLIAVVLLPAHNWRALWAGVWRQRNSGESTMPASGNKHLV